jgi:hypothetical protein
MKRWGLWLAVVITAANGVVRAQDAGVATAVTEPDVQTTEPVVTSVVVIPAAPAPATTASTSDIHVSAEPGRGVRITAGDAFSLEARARIQLRETLHIPSTVPNSGELSNELGIRTIRIWLQGNVLDPHVRYGIQLALGPNDFEPNNPSPIYDAYFDFTHLRDLSVRAGQFFVPLDRARTIREFALQTVDRANMVRELSLDRDVGIMLYSDDLFGCNGILAYRAGIFGGDGRNRINTQRIGFLYVGRFTLRPMGPFDDDMEGDLTRSTSPHLAFGVGVAYNQNTDRSRSTTSSSTTQPFYTLGGFDYFNAAADVVFKWGGFSFLGEFLYRSASAGQRSQTTTNPMTMMMTTVTEYTRQAWGLTGQMGMMLGEQVEIWARYEQTTAFVGTDPSLIATINSAGRVTAGGVNVYINGHFFKIQADWLHSFGNDYTVGEHQVRLQIDATF